MEGLPNSSERESAGRRTGRGCILCETPGLFEDMLYEMGLALGYDFDKTQIGRDAYSTLYHEKMEADALTIRTKLVEVLTGKAFACDLIAFFARLALKGQS